MDPMNIHIRKSALNVFKSSLLCNSKAQNFYLYLIGKHNNIIDKTLYGRSLQFSKTNNFHLFQYIMNCEKDKHLREIFPPVKNGLDGIVDTVRFLLDSYHKPQRGMLHHLFSAY